MKVSTLTVMLKDGRLESVSAPASAGLIEMAKKVRQTGLFGKKEASEVLVYSYGRMGPLFKGKCSSSTKDEPKG